MKILIVSPTYFSDESLIGGGERYAFELASALSLHAETVFFSFSDKPRVYQKGKLEIALAPKKLWREQAFDPLLWQKVKEADVIHFHQPFNFAIDFVTPVAKLAGKKIFITDLGGGEPFALSYHLPLQRMANGMLLISGYSKKLWQEKRWVQRPQKMEVIYGGVNTETFRPAASGGAKNYILFVGRILPHKGISDLVQAAEASMPVKIVGRPYHKDYLEYLQASAAGKNIEFYLSCQDDQLAAFYQDAAVTVLPSVYKDHYGNTSLIPELLGLTSLESQACGTPSVVTSVASLPETVREGVDGFIVPPNNPEALRHCLKQCLASPEKMKSMGVAAREKILDQFTWQKTAERCFNFYRTL